MWTLAHHRTLHHVCVSDPLLKCPELAASRLCTCVTRPRPTPAGSEPSDDQGAPLRACDGSRRGTPTGSGVRRRRRSRGARGILAACLSAGCLMVFAFRAPMPRWDLLLCCALLAVCWFVLAPAAWWARRLDIGEAEAQRHAVARCRSHPVPLPEGSARAAAAPPLPHRLPLDTDAWRRRVRLTWRLCLALPLVALVLHGPRAGGDGTQALPGYVL